MPRFGLVGPSYTDQAVNADAQMTMNLYPEVIESGAGNAPIILLPTPGLQSFATITPPAPLTVAINNTSNSVFGSWSTGQSTYTITVTPSSDAINVGDVAFVMAVTNCNPSPAGLTNGVTGITDNKGNTWTKIGSTQSPIVDPYTHYIVNIFYARMGTAIPSVGTLVLTATLDQPSNVTSITNQPGFMNVTNITSTPMGSPIQVLVSTANPSAGPIITTSPAALFSFLTGWSSGTPQAIPSGWSNTNITATLFSEPGWGAAWIQENTLGSYSSAWTAGAPVSLSDWGITLVAFPVA